MNHDLVVVNDFLIFILQSTYILLPAGFANMAPVLFSHTLKSLNIPLDFGMKYKGIRILGSHKTWRGLIAGILLAIFVTYTQKFLYWHPFFRQISVVDYSHISILLLGFLLGSGALIGDAVKSYFKRRMHLKPGADWFPYDQLDWVIGSAFFIWPFYSFYWQNYIAAIITYFFLHLLTKKLGYALKLDKPNKK